MKQKSLANPKAYEEKTAVYDKFAEAEDWPKIIEKFVTPKVKNKIVLDLGCGSGKYSKIFARYAAKIYGVDISEKQLDFALKKVGQSKKVKFFRSSAEEIPLADKSVDIIFSAWMISVIQGAKKRKRVLSEMERVLKDHGKVFIFENDSTGKFEVIRRHLQRTKKYDILRTLKCAVSVA